MMQNPTVKKWVIKLKFKKKNKIKENHIYFIDFQIALLVNYQLIRPCN